MHVLHCPFACRMDSFVLAETFKYLYLLFAEEEELVIPIDDYVFTTEAHLLSLSLSRVQKVNIMQSFVCVAFKSHSSCIRIHTYTQHICTYVAYVCSVLCGTQYILRILIKLPPSYLPNLSICHNFPRTIYIVCNQ